MGRSGQSQYGRMRCRSRSYDPVRPAGRSRVRRYTPWPVKTAVEPLEGNKVKLSVEVDEDEFEKAIDAAFRKIAREVRIPGLPARQGAPPDPRGAARRRRRPAARRCSDALPEYYARGGPRARRRRHRRARDRHHRRAERRGRSPSTPSSRSGPTVTVPGYDSLRVDDPRRRARPTRRSTRRSSGCARSSASSRPSSGPRSTDDYVTIDIAGSQDGEPLDGLTADDYLYEVGSGGIRARARRAAPRRRSRATSSSSSAASRRSGRGADRTSGSSSKRSRSAVLPDLDDEFANEASEFETLDELRDDLASRMTTRCKRVQAQMALAREGRRGAGRARRRRAPRGARRRRDAGHACRTSPCACRPRASRSSSGSAATGRARKICSASCARRPTTAAKVDLALRAVAEAEAIEADRRRPRGRVRAPRERVDLEARPSLRKADLERAEQIEAIRSDIKKRKALDWLVETVEIVDDDGNAIDRADLETGAAADRAPTDADPTTRTRRHETRSRPQPTKKKRTASDRPTATISSRRHRADQPG